MEPSGVARLEVERTSPKKSSQQELIAASEAVEQEYNAVRRLKRLSIGNSLNFDPDLPLPTTENYYNDDIDTINNNIQVQQKNLKRSKSKLSKHSVTRSSQSSRSSNHSFHSYDDNYNDNNNDNNNDNDNDNYSLNSNNSYDKSYQSENNKDSNLIEFNDSLDNIDNQTIIHKSIYSKESPNILISNDENDLDFDNQDVDFVDLESDHVFDESIWVPATAHPEISLENFKKHVQKNNINNNIINNHDIDDITMKNPSLKELTVQLQTLSQNAGLNDDDAVTLARSLSTRSIGISKIEKEAYLIDDHENNRNNNNINYTNNNNDNKLSKSSGDLSRVKSRKILLRNKLNNSKTRESLFIKDEDLNNVDRDDLIDMDNNLENDKNSVPPDFVSNLKRNGWTNYRRQQNISQNSNLSSNSTPTLPNLPNLPQFIGTNNKAPQAHVYKDIRKIHNAQKPLGKPQLEPIKLKSPSSRLPDIPTSNDTATSPTNTSPTSNQPINPYLPTGQTLNDKYSSNLHRNDINHHGNKIPNNRINHQRQNYQQYPQSFNGSRNNQNIPIRHNNNLPPRQQQHQLPHQHQKQKFSPQHQSQHNNQQQQQQPLQQYPLHHHEQSKPSSKSSSHQRNNHYNNQPQNRVPDRHLRPNQNISNSHQRYDNSMKSPVDSEFKKSVVSVPVYNNQNQSRKTHQTQNEQHHHAVEQNQHLSSSHQRNRYGMDLKEIHLSDTQSKLSRDAHTSTTTVTEENSIKPKVNVINEGNSKPIIEEKVKPSPVIVEIPVVNAEKVKEAEKDKEKEKEKEKSKGKTSFTSFFKIKRDKPRSSSVTSIDTSEEKKPSFKSKRTFSHTSESGSSSPKTDFKSFFGGKKEKEKEKEKDKHKLHTEKGVITNTNNHIENSSPSVTKNTNTSTHAGSSPKLGLGFFTLNKSNDSLVEKKEKEKEKEKRKEKEQEKEVVQIVEKDAVKAKELNPVKNISPKSNGVVKKDVFEEQNETVSKTTPVEIVETEANDTFKVEEVPTDKKVALRKESTSSDHSPFANSSLSQERLDDSSEVDEVTDVVSSTFTDELNTADETKQNDNTVNKGSIGSLVKVIKSDTKDEKTENNESTELIKQSLKKTLDENEKPTKPNQPLEMRDSAFGFPLPPVSQSTLVMLDHRFPVHVERAIYRLSHLKLADPKRPLRQQVLLSNFMYSYLNLVNHTLWIQSKEQENADENVLPETSNDQKLAITSTAS